MVLAEGFYGGVELAALGHHREVQADLLLVDGGLLSVRRAGLAHRDLQSRLLQAVDQHRTHQGRAQVDDDVFLSHDGDNRRGHPARVETAARL